MNIREKISWPEEGDFQWYETLVIRRFHPRWILLRAAFTPWAIYFLWLHAWAMALTVMACSAGIGFVATSDVNAKGYAKTLLGKLALLHLYPLNLFIQAVGILGLTWAIWAHSVVGVLSAISVIFLGHFSGWDDVMKSSIGISGRREAA